MFIFYEVGMGGWDLRGAKKRYSCKGGGAVKRIWSVRGGGALRIIILLSVVMRASVIVKKIARMPKITFLRF